MLTEVIRGKITVPGDPFYQNLPGQRQRLSCLCGNQARVLVLVPGQRLDRCAACYRELAPYLDVSCNLLFIGGP